MTAAKLLNHHGTLPVLFRQQEDSDAVLACRFVAELVEIRFPEQFDSDATRLAWLEGKLWLQRETIIKMHKPTERYPIWEAQFKSSEIDDSLDAKTWYVIRSLREIKPLPLPRLRKLKKNQPLAPNFVRGYALCHYPSDEVKVVNGRPAAL